MLEKSLEHLRDKNNLLAFSAGVDSSALFFLLLENGVDFDIAIVDYGKRASSSDEVAYAKELAKTHNKNCFSKTIHLEDKNFEHSAREVRYSFFEEIIKTKNYENLLTAHQLNDRLEWFLMQFTKGAGVVELLGFEFFEKRENYNLIRPLIDTPKQKLLDFLKKNSIRYFEDESNSDLKYRRNRFRLEFSNSLLKDYEKGIIKSFEYLKKDKNQLFQLHIIKQIDKLYILKNSNNDIENLRAIDKIIKKLGLIISTKQRSEILRQKEIVISGKIAVCINDKEIFISPYLKPIMSKEFKQKARVLKIPPKIRGYIWHKNILNQI